MARTAVEHSGCRGCGRGRGSSAGRAKERHGADPRVEVVLVAFLHDREDINWRVSVQCPQNSQAQTLSVSSPLWEQEAWPWGITTRAPTDCVFLLPSDPSAHPWQPLLGPNKCPMCTFLDWGLVRVGKVPPQLVSWAPREAGQG